MKQPRLPAELSRLAAQLVHERVRREAWTATAALRRDLAARIAAGESAEALQAALAADVARAVVCARPAHARGDGGPNAGGAGVGAAPG